MVMSDLRSQNTGAGMEPGDISIENGEDPRPSNYRRKDAWFVHVHFKEEERNYQWTVMYKTRKSIHVSSDPSFYM